MKRIILGALAAAASVALAASAQSGTRDSTGAGERNTQSPSSRDTMGRDTTGRDSSMGKSDDGARKDTAKASKGEAKRHITTANVAMESAKSGLQGLYTLADDKDGAWDATHHKALVDAVERDLKMAAHHLQELTSVTANDKNGQTDLTKAQTSLARVQAELKNLESPATNSMTGHGSGGDTGMTGSGGDTGSSRNTMKAGNDALKQQIKTAWKALDDANSDFKKVADDYKVSTRLAKP